MKRLPPLLKSYLNDFDIKLGKTYLLRGRRGGVVVPVIESEDHQGALGHGFIHFRYQETNEVNFCGVAHFQRKATLV